VEGLSISDVALSDSTARYLVAGAGQWKKRLSLRSLPWLPPLIADVLRATNRVGCPK
jgi:hypothetical protein